MSTTTILARRIAGAVQARLNCLSKAEPNTEWADRHEDTVASLMREHLPSGSGFDAGVEIDWDESTGEKLVFNTQFHNMDEHGGYCGWSSYTITVTGSLLHPVTVEVVCTDAKDYNDGADYVGDVFHDALTAAVSD